MFIASFKPSTNVPHTTNRFSDTALVSFQILSDEDDMAGAREYKGLRERPRATKSFNRIAYKIAPREADISVRPLSGRSDMTGFEVKGCIANVELK